MATERVDGAAAARRHVAQPWPIDVRSTLGAGDVFHGALLAGLVEERPLGEALDRASACAALACEALDGRSGIPDVARLDRFVASGRDRAADAGFHG
jgi:sulfofructose kinase